MPDYSNEKIFTPKMTPDFLEYFFLLKTDLFASLTVEQQNTFFNIYTHYFANSDLTPFLAQKKESSNRRTKYRVPTQIPCSLKVKGQALYKMGVVRDLSMDGCFVHFFTEDEMGIEFESIQFSINQHPC